jgi:hypothetical protein
MEDINFAIGAEISEHDPGLISSELDTGGAIFLGLHASRVIHYNGDVRQANGEYGLCKRQDQQQ